MVIYCTEDYNYYCDTKKILKKTKRMYEKLVQIACDKIKHNKNFPQLGEKFFLYQK